MTTSLANNNRNLRLQVLNTNSDAAGLNHGDNLEQSSFNPNVTQDRRGEDISLDKEKMFEIDQNHE